MFYFQTSDTITSDWPGRCLGLGSLWGYPKVGVSWQMCPGVFWI